jgi:hypothetical protein
MPTKRVFPQDAVEKKAEDYHGGCRYQRTLPDIASQGISSANVEIPFEEALKLSLALQSCLIALNKNKRSTIGGKRMGVLLSLKTENSSISVMEKKLGPVDDGS